MSDPEWHQMENAPRDGAWFLGWNGRFWFVASWCEPTRAGGEGEFLAVGMRPVEPPLTHWMALQEGPA